MKKEEKICYWYMGGGALAKSQLKAAGEGAAKGQKRTEKEEQLKQTKNKKK